MKNLPPYTLFPMIYDPMMKHILFKSWTNFILESMEPDYPTTLLDLGCGTGSLLKEFPPMLHKTGLDRSEKMLEIAKIRVPNVEWVVSDMISFKSPRLYDLVVCTHDCLNYIINIYELQMHFFSVRDALEKGGYYFFDISSEYNLKKNFHNHTIRESFDSMNILWENRYDEYRKEITSTLTFEVQTNRGTEVSREVHIQKYYSIEEIKILAEKSGFEVLKIGSDYKKWKLDPSASLITFLARKR